MGAGIAQVAALGGYDTYLHDPDADALAAGELRLRGDLLKGADRARWTKAEAEAASARLRTATRLDQLAGCELVIEAAPESLGLKRVLFDQLESICGAEAILATNTSSLSVSEIAAAAVRPERICGMHFFNPPRAYATRRGRGRGGDRGGRPRDGDRGGRADGPGPGPSP